MKVKRIELQEGSNEITFDIKGAKFLVKNFTNRDILVNFEPIDSSNQNTSIKIPKDVAQIIFDNEHLLFATKTDKIYVFANNGTSGEVEVQIICY